MKTSGQINMREFAWNGIRFTAPEKWEAAKIGNRYLLLEENARPMMEVKWNRVNGKFSHRRHLRRLAGQHPVSEYVLPPQWKTALANYHASGFRWEGKTFQGSGAILYCPACRNAALIQFYSHPSTPTESVAHRILASFHDHLHGEQALWSVFDIRAQIPARFKLASFRFNPGHFFLKFLSGRQTLTLNRWSPASSLLAGKNLLELAATLKQIPKGNNYRIRFSDGDLAVEGASKSSSRQWLSILRPSISSSPIQHFRLWHLPNKNRILGLRLESNKPVDITLFHRLCAGYESL